MKAAIYLAGALIWIYIFYHLDLTRLDWPSNVYYLNCWRENLAEWNFPPTCEPKLGFHGTNMMYWAYPFYLASLFSWLPDRVAFCLVWLINYTIGFWGAVKLWGLNEKRTEGVAYQSSEDSSAMDDAFSPTSRMGRVLSGRPRAALCVDLLAQALQRATARIGFALFWFLFCFNGFMVLKLEAGHIQNAGYLLIPGFLYLVKRQVN